jgi:multidrug efflux system outer membrane protein
LITPFIRLFTAQRTHRTIPGALTEKLSKPAPLPKIPKTIHIGQPAELLRRRPDIRIAERALAAATARIGVATADLFPRVTFVGTIALEASTLSGVAGAASMFIQLAPRSVAAWICRVYARIKAPTRVPRPAWLSTTDGAEGFGRNGMRW